MTKYEQTNNELVAIIRQMRDEIDPKKMEEFDKLAIEKLQELGAQLKGEYHTRIIES